MPLSGKVQAKKLYFTPLSYVSKDETTKIGLACRVNGVWLQIFRSQTYFSLQSLFNHLLINEASGRTLENIYGGGRLKAKLRKTATHANVSSFRKKFGYNARCHWQKERALSEYKTRSWAKATTPISSMPDHFPLAFFFRESKVNFRNERADK